jgi:hypothetical protein
MITTLPRVPADFPNDRPIDGPRRSEPPHHEPGPERLALDETPQRVMGSQEARCAS